MLVPAQLYEEEIQTGLIACWYQPKYSYYFSGEYNHFELADNGYWRRDYAHINSEGECDGYFGYAFNETDKSMRNFGLVSFAENGSALVADVKEHMKEMLGSIAQRAEFFVYADNPVLRIYQRFIKCYGGRQVGCLTRSSYFDGKYHDAIIFEILKEEFKV